MNSQEYFQKCRERNTYIGPDGNKRVKIQQATKDWAAQYPNEPCALVKRKSVVADVWDNNWVHLLLPEFFVEQYTEHHNYGGTEWFAVVGNYEDVRKEQRHTIEANING